MTDQHLLALYGLKYNPFLPNIPFEDLWRPPELELFFSRLETLLRHGGFAMIEGEVGHGKSKTLQLLAGHLEQLGEVVVGVMERPQSSVSDFYRELGDLFGVNLSPSNRYGGFKALRARWHNHVKGTLYRPILLVDEAQEACTSSLNELRLLGSVHFDSQCLLTTVLCGDTRLPDRFRTRDLLPLGSRIRTRLSIGPLDPNDLRDFLEHILEHAGAPQLITETLKDTLCEHSAGNLRVLTNMGQELLTAAAGRELPTLDEKLFFDVFTQKPKSRRSRKQTAASAA